MEKSFPYESWKYLYEPKCSKCHPLDRILADTKTEEEWRSCITRMIEKRPLWITPEEGVAMSINYTHQCNGTHDNHEKNHICQIVSRRDLGRVKELVKDSKFFCKNCGRTAHNAENLCNSSTI